AREVVVAVCSVVLAATFFYIFNDFLNVEVRALSQRMRDVFAHGASVIVLLVATAIAERTIKHERLAQESLASSAKRLGEHQQVATLFSWLRYLTIYGLAFGLSWWFIERWLVQWEWPVVLTAQSLCTLGVILGQFSQRSMRRQEEIDNRVNIDRA